MARGTRQGRAHYITAKGPHSLPRLSTATPGTDPELPPWAEVTRQGPRSSPRHRRLGIPRTATLPTPTLFLVKNKSADPPAVRKPVPPAVPPGVPGPASPTTTGAAYRRTDTARPGPTSDINKHLLQPRTTGAGGGSHGLEFFKVGQQTTAHACTHSPPHWPRLATHRTAQGRGCLREHACQQRVSRAAA